MKKINLYVGVILFIILSNVFVIFYATFFESESYYNRFVDYYSDSQSWHGVDYMLECLTWGGLRNTEAWSVLLSDEQAKNKYYDQINNIISTLPKDCN